MQNITWYQTYRGGKEFRHSLGIQEFPIVDVVGFAADGNNQTGIYLHVVGSHSETNAIMASVLSNKRFPTYINVESLQGDYYEGDFYTVRELSYYIGWNSSDIGGYKTKRVALSATQQSLYIWAERYFTSPKRRAFIIPSSMKDRPFSMCPIETWEWTDFANVVFNVATLPKQMFILPDGQYDTQKMKKLYVELSESDNGIESKIESAGYFHISKEFKPFTVRTLTARHEKIDAILAKLAAQ